MLGLGQLTCAAVNPTMLAAIVISNVPAEPARTADMKRAGKGSKDGFAICGSIAVLSGLAAGMGTSLSATPRGRPSQPSSRWERAASWG